MTAASRPAPIAGVVLSAWLLFALPAPAHAASSREGCFPKGSRTVLAARQVRVFQSRGGIRNGRSGYYACNYRTGRPGSILEPRHPDSLPRRDSRVTWRNGLEPRSATLR